MSPEPDLCGWCGHPEADHGPPGASPMGGPTDRLCPKPGVTSQFYTPMRRKDGGGDLTVTDADREVDPLECLRLAEAAGPGPWIVAHCPTDDSEGHFCAYIAGPNYSTPSHVYGRAFRRGRVEFIAHAHAALPALARRVLAAEAERDRMRAALEAISLAPTGVFANGVSANVVQIALDAIDVTRRE